MIFGSHDYERGIGWTPHDVSKDGEHYDIRSESRTEEKKYIEVKGRAEHPNRRGIT